MFLHNLTTVKVVCINLTPVCGSRFTFLQLFYANNRFYACALSHINNTSTFPSGGFKVLVFILATWCFLNLVIICLVVLWFSVFSDGSCRCLHLWLIFYDYSDVFCEVSESLSSLNLTILFFLSQRRQPSFPLSVRQGVVSTVDFNCYRARTFCLDFVRLTSEILKIFCRKTVVCRVCFVLFSSWERCFEGEN